VVWAVQTTARPMLHCRMTLCKFSFCAGLSPICVFLWSLMLTILILLSPLLPTSVAMTWSFAPLLKSVRSSTPKPLALRMAVQTFFLFLMSYSKWLIPLPPFSIVGTCKHTMSALCSTPVSRAAMVHSYDLGQLCWITLIIGSQGSRCIVIFSHGHRRSLGPGHHDVSPHPRCLLCLPPNHLLFFASPICRRSCPGTTTKLHSVRPRCSVHVNSIGRGSPSCGSLHSALLRHSGGFTLLRAPAAEHNMISFAVGALFQCVAAE